MSLSQCALLTGRKNGLSTAVATVQNVRHKVSHCAWHDIVQPDLAHGQPDTADVRGQELG